MDKISALKDRDLMSDTGGITKTRDYGEHKRPPRIQQRDNFRKRYLDKEEKKDLFADMNLTVSENGQVYVNDDNNKHNVYKTVSDYVGIPESLQQKKYDVALQDSLNKDLNLNDIQVNEQQNTQFAKFDNFSFDDIEEDNFEYSAQEEQEVETTDQENESNPFDDLFSGQTEESEQETQEESEQETQETTNDPIDEYLNLQIDDSNLSEQNKKKLDSFSSEQLDAFKKFLYENKIKQQETEQ